MKNFFKDAYYAILSHGFSGRMTKANLAEAFEIQFYKDNNGKWNADIPEWPGSHAQLLMVGPSHEFLENINRIEGLNGIVKMKICSGLIYADEDDVMETALKINEDSSGATYQCVDEKYGRFFWLCNVSKWCFGEHPTNIYYKITNIDPSRNKD